MILARRVPIAYTTALVTINQDMKALKPRAGISALFLASFLVSNQNAFVPLIDHAGHGTCRLPTERWCKIDVPIPPQTEQSAIIDRVNRDTARLDAAITANRRAVELLREFRMRLIADVVTGKLDVRDVAAQLPEERLDVEDEALDEAAEDAENLDDVEPEGALETGTYE